MGRKAMMQIACAVVPTILLHNAVAQSDKLVPGKPVRLLIPAAPGGNPDVLARAMIPKMQASLGVPIVVDNQPGGGGIGGAITTANAAPDGHTLFFGGSGSMIIPVAVNPKLPIHPLKSFTHITGLAAVPTVLVGDASRLCQVLVNLIRNAAEAMAAVACRELTLSARLVTEGTRVEIAVADSGPGISALIRPRLFKSFVTTKPEGTGLGLSTARLIIQAHDGDLWAEDRAEGGTVFRLTLPVASSPPVTPE